MLCPAPLLLVLWLPSSPASGSGLELSDLREEVQQILQASNISPEELVGLLRDGEIGKGQLDYIIEAVGEEVVIRIKTQDDVVYSGPDYDAEEEEEILSVNDNTAEEKDMDEDEALDYYSNSQFEGALDTVVNGIEPSPEMHERGDKKMPRLTKGTIIGEVEYEDMAQNKKVYEIVILAGIALACLAVLFGMISLASSVFNGRSSPVTEQAPYQVQTACSGSIIRRYTLLPTDIRNLVPSDVAYRQLYEGASGD